MPKTKKNTAIISKTFVYKMGQPNYSSVEFGCSVTKEVELLKPETGAEEAIKLDEFCKASVRISMKEFVESVAAKEKAEVERVKAFQVAKGIAEFNAKNAKAKVADDKANAKQGAELDAAAGTAERLTYEDDNGKKMQSAFGK